MGLKMPRLYSQDLAPEWWQFRSPSNSKLFDRDTDSNCELVTDDDDCRPVSRSTDKKLDALIGAVSILTCAVKSALVGNGTVGINKFLSKVTTYTEGKTEVYILSEVIENIDQYINTVDALDYRHKMVAPLTEFIMDLWDDNPKGFKKVKRFIKRELNLDSIRELMDNSDYDFEDADDVRVFAMVMLKGLQKYDPAAANRLKSLVVLGDAIRKRIETLSTQKSS